MTLYITAMQWFFAAQLAVEAVLCLFRPHTFLNAVFEKGVVAKIMSTALLPHIATALGACSAGLSALNALAALSGDRKTQIMAARATLVPLGILTVDLLTHSFIRPSPVINWLAYTSALTAMTTLHTVWCAINAFDLVSDGAVGPSATQAGRAKMT